MPTKEEMHDLGQGIIASFEARTAGVATIRRETQTQLGELDRNHQAMARRLRADLAQGRATLTKQDGQLRADLARGRADLRTSVSAQLRELDQTHNVMARQMRTHLARGRADLQQQVGELRSDLKRGCASLSKAEAGRKAEVATEHAGARQEWRRLTRTMGSKRNGAVMTEEFTALGDRVFQYLANHPDGARLTEIEREFGVGRLQAGKVVRHLMDEGKAEKRDLCYFAT